MAEERGEERRGFKVIDRRIFAQKEGEKGQGEEKAEEAKKEESREEVPLPEVTFSSFIYSLSTTCLVHLGEIPEPVSQKVQKNLPLAKQTIDVLDILLEKTRGNLTEEEERLLRSVITDLRIRYVKAVSS
ncbi:MAG: DUF1844 domain-containing protein [Deltaproteobacteria bacterium]|nr:MAG: DUF1844 domain-containing protein [Deltaproteobacteria bacterium]RLA99909.1 MAG: DUF1844 domain-containing protein [Deltaproteobacteria bacterium]